MHKVKASVCQNRVSYVTPRNHVNTVTDIDERVLLGVLKTCV